MLRFRIDRRDTGRGFMATTCLGLVALTLDGDGRNLLNCPGSGAFGGEDDVGPGRIGIQILHGGL